MAFLHRVRARTASVGPFSVRRVLPTAQCRRVGPWVFVDHFGPATLSLSRALDVLPHPHCALSTVTTLFEGSIEHRDSAGGHAIIRPGEVHWMRAGHGIVHSERTPSDRLGTEMRREGLQLWCAHPDGEEEQEPTFGSWTDLPDLDVDGARVQLLAGQGWGQASPVEVTSNLVYALVHLREGQRVRLPDHEERSAYPIHGTVAVDGDTAAAHEMLVVDPRARELIAVGDAVVAILGGDGIRPRHMWWNLIHSDPDRLRDQAARWKRGEFPSIPGDSEEFVPAPDGPVVPNRTRRA